MVGAEARYDKFSLMTDGIFTSLSLTTDASKFNTLNVPGAAGPLTWKNQTLTPNPNTIYVFPFYNTKDAGPMVLEIPPADQDELDHREASTTRGRRRIADVGPAGVDKGKGGKYLILPPGYKEKVPDGYIPLPSSTYTGFAILRSNLKGGSDADIAKAVAYGKRIKFYPLSQAANAPQTKFVDAIDVVFDSTIPYDLRFFEALDRFVQREPWLDRDRVMIDFAQDDRHREGQAVQARTRRPSRFSSDAVREAHAWLDHAVRAACSRRRTTRARTGALPASPEVLEGMMTDFADPDAYPGRRPRRHLFLRVSSAPSTWARDSST